MLAEALANLRKGVARRDCRCTCNARECPPSAAVLARLRYARVVGLVLIVLFSAAIRSWADAQKEAEEARRGLQQQGFKIDLSQFDFSADYQTAIRAAALTNISFPRPIVLLLPCGTESAVVAWKQSRFEEEEGYQNLPSVEQLLVTNQPVLDSACAAILAGPIRFPLKAIHGSAMLLVHLAALRSLSQALAAREITELREQHYSAAWTNLLALTRLATAWEPEASEISHLVRFNLARTGWKAAWQALQAHNWTEEQLLALQREWEAPDFFKGLPETIAFERASVVHECVLERTAPSPPGPSLKSTLEDVVHSPRLALTDAKYRLDQARYRVTGTYEDERDLLLFFRDRELEFRKAVAAPTWQEMRPLPGVTNTIPFQSQNYSRMRALLNTRQIARSFQLEGRTFLGRAAQTEARRRLVIAALALERYRLAHGSYPNELQSVALDLLKTVPLDFMDGKPLRYRLCDPNAFVLYSVGLDCLDNGGKLSILQNQQRTWPKLDPFDDPNMIWPRAASDAEVQILQFEQIRAKQQMTRALERQASERDEQAEQQRQNKVAELARIYAKGGTPKIPDPKIEGGLLSRVMRNKANTGPALTLDQMLTLRQVTTGKEPDIVTFELPIRYDVLTNIGTVQLLCDSDPREDSPQAEDCKRATNGNCLLAWDTTYDPPGRHFLQAELSIDESLTRPSQRVVDPQELTLRGPLVAFFSTNVLQFFPLGNVYSDKGAFFRARLAQRVGSCSLTLTSPSGEHLRTITSSTTNGIVELNWDLICENGTRYTNESFNSSWTVTFPDPRPEAISSRVNLSPQQGPGVQ